MLPSSNSVDSLKETTASNKYLDRIAISQEHMSQRLHESTSNVDRLAGQGKIITDNVTHVTKVVHNMHAVSNNNMAEIKNNIGQMATAVTGMSHVIKEQAASSSNYESHLIRVEKLLEQLVQSQQQMITDLKVMGSTGAGAASGSLSAQISDVGDMNNDISTMLKEIENAD